MGEIPGDSYERDLPKQGRRALRLRTQKIEDVFLQESEESNPFVPENLNSAMGK